MLLHLLFMFFFFFIWAVSFYFIVLEYSFLVQLHLIFSGKLLVNSLVKTKNFSKEKWVKMKERSI